MEYQNIAFFRAELMLRSNPGFDVQTVFSSDLQICPLK